MPPPDVAPEVQFLRTPLGGIITVLVALLAFIAVVIWACRPGHPDRWILLAAASSTAMLMTAINILAVGAGWWRGGFFSGTPLVVLAAIDIPFAIAAWTIWLRGYRWLTVHSRHALTIYAGVVLLFIPVVVLVDPVQMARGHFTLGGGYTIWIDAFVGQVVMASPVLFYELLRRRYRTA